MKRFPSLILISVLAVMLAVAGCAPAATDGETTATGFQGFIFPILILVLIFAMFYFLMIRPIRQREKKHDELVQQLEVGDKVITAGGIYGTIVTISQDSVVIRVESGATLRVTKGSILARPTEGS